MKKYHTCLNCDGTGYEDHSYVREDGERVVERIICECCNGTGKVQDFINELQTNEEIIAKQSSSPEHNYANSFEFNDAFDEQY